MLNATLSKQYEKNILLPFGYTKYLIKYIVFC